MVGYKASIQSSQSPVSDSQNKVVFTIWFERRKQVRHREITQISQEVKVETRRLYSEVRLWAFFSWSHITISISAFRFVTDSYLLHLVILRSLLGFLLTYRLFIFSYLGGLGRFIHLESFVTRLGYLKRLYDNIIDHGLKVSHSFTQ